MVGACLAQDVVSNHPCYVVVEFAALIQGLNEFGGLLQQTQVYVLCQVPEVEFGLLPRSLHRPQAVFDKTPFGIGLNYLGVFHIPYQIIPVAVHMVSCSLCPRV